MMMSEGKDIDPTARHMKYRQFEGVDAAARSVYRAMEEDVKDSYDNGRKETNFYLRLFAFDLKQALEQLIKEKKGERNNE
jgi:hypothetical protein